MKIDTTINQSEVFQRWIHNVLRGSSPPLFHALPVDAFVDTLGDGTRLLRILEQLSGQRFPPASSRIGQLSGTLRRKLSRRAVDASRQHSAAHFLRSAEQLGLQLAVGSEPVTPEQLAVNDPDAVFAVLRALMAFFHSPQSVADRAAAAATASAAATAEAIAAQPSDSKSHAAAQASSWSAKSDDGGDEHDEAADDEVGDLASSPSPGKSSTARRFSSLFKGEQQQHQHDEAADDEVGDLASSPSPGKSSTARRFSSLFKGSLSSAAAAAAAAGLSKRPTVPFDEALDAVVSWARSRVIAAGAHGFVVSDASDRLESPAAFVDPVVLTALAAALLTAHSGGHQLVPPNPRVATDDRSYARDAIQSVLRAVQAAVTGAVAGASAADATAWVPLCSADSLVDAYWNAVHDEDDDDDDGEEEEEEEEEGLVGDVCVGAMLLDWYWFFEGTGQLAAAAAAAATSGGHSSSSNSSSKTPHETPRSASSASLGKGNVLVVPGGMVDALIRGSPRLSARDRSSPRLDSVEPPPPPQQRELASSARESSAAADEDDEEDTGDDDDEDGDDGVGDDDSSSTPTATTSSSNMNKRPHHRRSRKSPRRSAGGDDDESEPVDVASAGTTTKKSLLAVSGKRTKKKAAGAAGAKNKDKDKGKVEVEESEEPTGGGKSIDEIREQIAQLREAIKQPARNKADFAKLDQSKAEIRQLEEQLSQHHQKKSPHDHQQQCTACKSLQFRLDEALAMCKRLSEQQPQGRVESAAEGAKLSRASSGSRIERRVGPLMQQALDDTSSKRGNKPTTPRKKARAAAAAAAANAEPEPVVALWDFETDTAGEQALRRGQVFLVTERREEWVKLQLVAGGGDRTAAADGGGGGWSPESHVVAVPALVERFVGVDQQLDETQAALAAAQASLKEATAAKKAVAATVHRARKNSMRNDEEPVTGRRLVQSLWPFKAGGGPDELPFGAGETIRVVATRGRDWLKGTLESSGRTGFFPASYVVDLDENGSGSGSGGGKKTTKRGKKKGAKAAAKSQQEVDQGNEEEAYEGGSPTTPSSVRRRLSDAVNNAVGSAKNMVKRAAAGGGGTTTITENDDDEEEEDEVGAKQESKPHQPPSLPSKEGVPDEELLHHEQQQQQQQQQQPQQQQQHSPARTGSSTKLTGTLRRFMRGVSHREMGRAPSSERAEVASGGAVAVAAAVAAEGAGAADDVYRFQIEQGVPVAGPSGKQFTTYLISFRHPVTGAPCSVLKRYSEFEALHRAFERQSSSLEASLLPSLPGKRLINNQDPAFVQRRAARLQDWLTVIATSFPKLTALENWTMFLGIFLDDDDGPHGGDDDDREEGGVDLEDDVDGGGGNDDVLTNDAGQLASVTAELLATERSYTGFLRTLHEAFEAPLLAVAGVDVDEIKRVFPSLGVLRNVNERLLERLEQADGRVQAVAQAFVDLAKFFRSYKQYVAKYPTALQTCVSVRRRWPEVERRVAAAEVQCGLGLRDLMIMPVQRLPRYVLLLERMARWSDCAVLRQALADMRASADEVDAARAHYEAIFRSELLSQSLVGFDLLAETRPGLAHLRTARVYQLLDEQRRRVPCTALLFDQLLVLCAGWPKDREAAGALQVRGPFKFRRSIQLTSIAAIRERTVAPGDLRRSSNTTTTITTSSSTSSSSSAFSAGEPIHEFSLVTSGPVLRFALPPADEATPDPDGEPGGRGLVEALRQAVKAEQKRIDERKFNRHRSGTRESPF